MNVGLSAGAYCVLNERGTRQIRLHIFILSSAILPLSHHSLRGQASPPLPPGPPYPYLFLGTRAQAAHLQRAEDKWSMATALERECIVLRSDHHCSYSSKSNTSIMCLSDPEAAWNSGELEDTQIGLCSAPHCYSIDREKNIHISKKTFTEECRENK